MPCRKSSCSRAGTALRPKFLTVRSNAPRSSGWRWSNESRSPRWAVRSVPYTSQKMTFVSLMRKRAVAKKIVCLEPTSARNFTIERGWCEEHCAGMSDFHQSGVITTFHRLGKYDLEAIEATLAEYAERRPIALVLPCLYSELEGPALKNILGHL